MIVLTREQYQAHTDNSEGICIQCGHTQGCVEPDAEGYTCEECDAPAVMGYEQAMINDLIYVSDE